MKITPKELKQIIKEEYQRTLNEMDDLEQDMYPGADERGDPDTWDRPDPYRVNALAAVEQLKEPWNTFCLRTIQKKPQIH